MADPSTWFIMTLEECFLRASSVGRNSQVAVWTLIGLCATSGRPMSTEAAMQSELENSAFAGYSANYSLFVVCNAMRAAERNAFIVVCVTEAWLAQE